VPTTEQYSTHPAPFVNLLSKILLSETAGGTQIFLFLFSR